MSDIVSSMDSFLTAAEAARWLGVSRQRIGQLREAGKLPAVHRGVWLFSRQDIIKAKSTLRFNRKRPTFSAN